MSAGAAVIVRAGRLWYGLSNCGLAPRFNVAELFTEGTEACRPSVRPAKMREQSKRRTTTLYESRVHGRSRQTLENNLSPLVLCRTLVASTQGRNCNKALGSIAFQQLTSGFNREFAIGPKSQVSAIVQQNDLSLRHSACIHLSCHFFRNGRSRFCAPVIAAHRPHHRTKFHAARHPQYVGPAAAKRRSKKRGLFPQRVFQGFATIAEFLSQPSR